jgi:pimeloyl-ACP methyl ester carboxylesterase
MLTTPPEQLTAMSEAFLPNITAPLLSLHGTKPPADYWTWLTRLVPTAVIEVWDGMGHFMHLVEPSRSVCYIGGITRLVGVVAEVDEQVVWAGTGPWWGIA